MTTERTGMDKERLLNYFQEHYLSRREVLFRLPLNLSIGNFWAELLNRRKAGAIVLPLYDANGMPYWYSLTSKMIAASEKLCAAAMRQTEEFDPYRMQMTAAMTEEMYFTSFVEGAQIPLEDAMDFLQRGTEPENIQEQLVWNNRQAWTMLTRNLHRPIDENYLKMLAYLLTDGMDGCAEDYRQSDEHFIPSMDGEPYILPSAVSLPNRMAEFSGFLQDGDIHPLIKAAAGQAYILVARPFPEGNERLSRMISSAVLLRSGYDFFRDISISAAIARENYGYYKAMREILRAENGGDLTYFMEYYLGLLVRAMETREERERERDRRRDKEALERERQLAQQPLSNPKPDEISRFAEIPRSAEIPKSAEFQTSAESFESDVTLGNAAPRNTTQENDALPKNISDIVNGAESISAFTAEAEEDFSAVPEVLPKESPPTAISAEFEEKLREMEQNKKHPALAQKASYIRAAIDEGFTVFTTAEWRQRFGWTSKEMDIFMQYLRRHGMIEWRVETNVHIYSLTVNSTCNQEQNADKEEDHSQGSQVTETQRLPLDEFMKRLNRIAQQSLDAGKRAAERLREMVMEGRNEFTCADFKEELGVSKDYVYDFMSRLRQKGLVVASGPNAYRRYTVMTQKDNTETAAEFEDILSDAPVNTPSGFSELPNRAIHEASPQMLTLLKQMASESATPRDQRIGTFLLNAISEGREEFDADDWMASFEESESQCLQDIKKAANMGLIRRSGTGTTRGHCRICFHPQIGTQSGDLTYHQRQLLTTIYQKYGGGIFRTIDVTEDWGINSSGAVYHLNNFRERGILNANRVPGNYNEFSFAVTPESNPECFNVEETPVANEQNNAKPAVLLSAAAG